MKVREVMTAHPVMATARDSDRDRVRRLMEDADVHHVPVVEGDLVVGVWAQTSDDSVFLLGPDRVVELSADADAGDAMAALMRDAEVVLVRDEGLPAGRSTRADALGILRAALGRGMGQRHRRPTVIRIAGPRGTGKTTLIMRTLARLGDLDAVILQANEPTGPETASGVDEVVDSSAHWRAGLARATARLSEAQLILVEDRDEQPDLSRGIGEDVQVAVLPVRRGRLARAARAARRPGDRPHPRRRVGAPRRAGGASALRGALARPRRLRRRRRGRRPRRGGVGALGPAPGDAAPRLTMRRRGLVPVAGCLLAAGTAVLPPAAAGAVWHSALPIAPDRIGYGFGLRSGRPRALGPRRSASRRTEASRLSQRRRVGSREIAWAPLGAAPVVRTAVGDVATGSWGRRPTGPRGAPRS